MGRLPGIIERPGFKCMIEMRMKMMGLGMSISEVPMVLDTSRRIGASRMHPDRTVIGYVGLFRHRRRWTH